jgi:hypothetical protein
MLIINEFNESVIGMGEALSKPLDIKKIKELCLSVLGCFNSLLESDRVEVECALAELEALFNVQKPAVDQVESARGHLYKVCARVVKDLPKFQVDFASAGNKPTTLSFAEIAKGVRLNIDRIQERMDEFEQTGNFEPAVPYVIQIASFVNFYMSSSSTGGSVG